MPARRVLLPTHRASPPIMTCRCCWWNRPATSISLHCAGIQPLSEPVCGGSRALRDAVQKPHAVLQLPSCGVERVAYGDVQVFVRVVLAGIAVHHDVSPGHRDIDVDLIQLALSVMPMSRFDDYPARFDAVGNFLEFLHAMAYLRLDRRGRIHVAKSDLQIEWHSSLQR